MSDARTRPPVATSPVVDGPAVENMTEPDPTRPIDADKSLGELVSRLTSDFGDLVSTQVELAKVEIKEELRRAGRGAGMVSGAAAVAYLAVIVLSLALAWLLDDVMARPLAFAIVGVAWGVVAAVLFARGRQELKSIEPPIQTKKSIEEDVEWARQQRN
ncbi:MAG: phage holin family protein [Acidimicrobiia bacterium]